MTSVKTKRTITEITIYFSGVNQDYSKHYVRLVIKIPEMKTSLSWRRMAREAKNGVITKATYHGTYVESFSSLIRI